jgi:HlyD family secretion protein
MNKIPLLILSIFLIACQKKVDSVKPEYQSITESIYATGVLKSENQYQAFSSVNGIVEKVFVTEGQKVHIGDPLILISNKTQELNKENAELAANFADISNNRGKIIEANQYVELAKNKLKVDSTFYQRQKNLWGQQIGTKAELEQKELLYLNSKAAYFSAIEKLSDLKKNLNFNANQSQKNLTISNKIADDFVIRSKLNGVVFKLTKVVGEIVTTQTPLATIGQPDRYFLEMQVDENDIFKIRLGQKVIATFDSYKNQFFEAEVTKIFPYMNEKSKSFLIEAVFVQSPPKLYPNLTFEASIVVKEKAKALLIPRSYLLGDSFVIKTNHGKIKIIPGLMDFQKVEVLSGLNVSDEIIKPAK